MADSLDSRIAVVTGVGSGTRPVTARRPVPGQVGRFAEGEELIPAVTFPAAGDALFTTATVLVRGGLSDVPVMPR